jgi:hypothetical protein
MYGVHNADLSVSLYAMHGTSESVFPLLYGIDNDVPVVPFDEHKVSEESINIDHIRAIYVPVDRVEEAKRILLEHGSEALSSRVKSSSIFDGTDAQCSFFSAADFGAD